MFKSKGKITHCPNCNSTNILVQKLAFEPRIKYVCKQCQTEVWFDGTKHIDTLWSRHDVATRNATERLHRPEICASCIRQNNHCPVMDSFSQTIKSFKELTIENIFRLETLSLKIDADCKDFVRKN